MKSMCSIALWTCLALALCLAACQQQPGATKQKSASQQLVEDSALEQILQRKIIRVGMDTFVPWAMKDKDGRFIGFEIDVARRLAKDMGVDIEFVPTKWAGIIPALLTGKFDVLIGGMSVRTDRNIKVNFTVPYYFTGMSMVADKKKCQGFAKLSDFNDPTVVIVSRTGTTAAIAAQKHIPKATHRFFDGEPQAVQELVAGRAHAMVASSPLPTEVMARYPDKLFLPLAETFTKEPIAMAVRKGDPDTLNFLDNWIRTVQAEDWFLERQHYWFGTRDWEDQIN